MHALLDNNGIDVSKTFYIKCESSYNKFAFYCSVHCPNQLNLYLGRFRLFFLLLAHAHYVGKQFYRYLLEKRNAMKIFTVYIIFNKRRVLL